MNPSKKSLEMTTILNKMTVRMFGRERTTSIASGVCVTCGQEVGEFRNALSEKEFTISGMCQNCQDSVFDVD